MIDKRQVLNRLSSIKPLAIELGCGNSKVDPNAIGVDMLDYEGVDLVGDVYEVLSRIPAGVADKISSRHFFEHVSDLQLLVRETARVLRPGGEMEVMVPHFSNPYFYSDPTHHSFFGLYSFSYLATDDIFRRKVPNYYGAFDFELVDAELIFRSEYPFRVRNRLKRMVGKVINSSRFMQEYYEEMISPVLPCYEIRFLLRKKR